MLRHAAALALVGWYLMFPPEQPGSLKVEDQAPISQWQSFRSFESAQECMSAKASAVQQSKVSKETMQTEVARRNVHLKALASQCIATDDPRLKCK
jgi:hypothetical protein